MAVSFQNITTNVLNESPFKNNSFERKKLREIANRHAKSFQAISELIRP